MRNSSTVQALDWETELHRVLLHGPVDFELTVSWNFTAGVAEFEVNGSSYATLAESKLDYVSDYSREAILGDLPGLRVSPAELAALREELDLFVRDYAIELEMI